MKALWEFIDKPSDVDAIERFGSTYCSRVGSDHAVKELWAMKVFDYMYQIEPSLEFNHALLQAMVGGEL